MKKKHRSKDRENAALSMLYGIMVVILLAIIIFMYFHWKERIIKYTEQVKQATQSESVYEIEFKKIDDTESKD